jgi:hypothetical protein
VRQPIISSRLLECGVWNRINARRLQDSHGVAVRGLIGRIAIAEMVPAVLRRAFEPFPVLVRTLDAAHLAAIEFIRSPLAACQLRRTAGWGCTSARNCRVERKFEYFYRWLILQRGIRSMTSVFQRAAGFEFIADNDTGAGLPFHKLQRKLPVRLI